MLDAWRAAVASHDRGCRRVDNFGAYGDTVDVGATDRLYFHLAGGTAPERGIRRGGPRLDRGDCAERILDPLQARRARLDGGIAPRRQQHRRGHEPGRVDANVDAVDGQEAAHHERGAREQHERQRKLGDDQARRPAAGTHTGGAAAAAFLERLVSGCSAVERSCSVADRCREAQAVAGFDLTREASATRARRCACPPPRER
jgi:hypothetical protein